MIISELKQEAADLAVEMSSAGGVLAAGTAIDRNQRKARAIPDKLWSRFIRLRSELFRRGVYDPVLGRFDSATVTQADNHDIAEHLAMISSSAL